MTSSVTDADAGRDYPLEQWYCAAFTDEIGDKPQARTICDRQIVFYRSQDGALAALTDRCPHRKAPLSLGQAIGDAIECPFHGMRFAPDGTCILIPSQDKIPPAAHLRSYPVRERDGHVWIWMGRQAANDDLIPDMHWNADPALAPVHGSMHLRCNYLAALDNLLDDTHLSFVHRNTIGTPKIVQSKLDIEGDDERVSFTRWTLDTPPSALHAKAGGFTTHVDRWFNVRFVTPGTVLIDVGSAPIGIGAPDGDRSKGIGLYSNHTVTPETATSCHYFWHAARNFSADDTELSNTLRGHMEATFVEDQDIVEAVQRNRDCDREPVPDLNLAGDVVTLRARRIIANLIRQEGFAPRSQVA